MSNEHPIKPPPTLVKQWMQEFYGSQCAAPGELVLYIADVAARWGADAELEACHRWLKNQTVGGNTADVLKKVRRPKPPSLKEQALEALKHAEEGWRPVPADCEIIRRALEELPDQ